MKMIVRKQKGLKQGQQNRWLRNAEKTYGRGKKKLH